MLEHVPEHVIGKSLEDHWGGGESKMHYQVLVVTEGCGEGGLPFIALPDADVSVNTPRIQMLAASYLQHTHRKLLVSL